MPTQHFLLLFCYLAATAYNNAMLEIFIITMSSFLEIAYYFVFIGIFVAIFCHYFFSKAKKDEEEYEENLQSRLNDELIYDPETGVKMTLEQAENGTWLKNDNLSRIRTHEEIEKYFDDREKVIERIANILKAEGYKSKKLSNEQIKDLEATQMLSKYDDWSYSNAIKINENDLVIFPKVHIYSRGKGSISFTGYQIMFWLKVPNILGHYFFREKETHEKILDFFRNDDEFELGEFEVFSIIKSKNTLQTKTILESFANLKSVEIELQNDNLFIKTTDEPSITAFNELFDVIKNTNR